MKKLSTIAIATVLLGLSSVALAKSHICTTKTMSTEYIEDKTEFVCTGGLTNMTMKEITQKGYRVVSIAVSNDPNISSYYANWAIVIEK